MLDYKNASQAGAAEINYRSIGVADGVLYAGGSLSTMAGSPTVYFDGAVLPAHIGCGDKLTINEGSADEQVLFIFSRDSDRQVTLQQPAGEDRTGAFYTIRRAYTSLQGWEDDRQGDLVAEDRLEVGICYNDGPFPAAGTYALVTIDGSRTDAQHFMWLTVAEGHRHHGIADTGVVLDGQDSGKIAVRPRDDYSRIEWLEIARFRGQNGAAGIEVKNAARVLLGRLLIYDFDSAAFSVVGIKGSDGAAFTARNCLIYDGDSAGVRMISSDAGASLENCSIYGMSGRGVYEDEGVLAATNCIAMGNGRADFDIVRGQQRNNLSSDETAVGPDCIVNAPASEQFISLAPGFEDLHLKPGADAVDGGQDLSGRFFEDIDAETRAMGAGWDIGADEYTVDDLPPALAIVAPAAGARIAQGWPEFTLVFYDDESGIDAASLQVAINAEDISAQFTVEAGGAWGRPVRLLPAGANTITARIADYAGNWAKASATFVVSDSSLEPGLNPIAPAGSSPGRDASAGSSSDVGLPIKGDGGPDPLRIAKAGAGPFKYQYQYDLYGNINQVIADIDGARYGFARQYDAAGRITQSGFPNGIVVEPYYTADGNLKKIDVTTAADGKQTYVTYDDFDVYNNKPQVVQYGNGVRSVYCYEPDLGRLLSMSSEHLPSSTKLLDYRYQWVAKSPLLLAGISDELDGRNQQFGYDRLDRLVSAQGVQTYGQRTFTYDPAGNLVQKDGTQFRYDANQVVAGAGGEHDGYSAGYDAAGNLVSQLNGANSKQHHFRYDAQNRLRQVRTDTAVLDRFSYTDGRRRLVKEDLPAGTRTIYVNEQYEVLQKAAVTETTVYINGAGGRLARITQTEAGSTLTHSGSLDGSDEITPGANGPGVPEAGVLYFHQNHIQSTSLTTDRDGRVTARMQYKPYGRILYANSEGRDNFREKFTGKEWDYNSGLYYFGARYYNPYTGRFAGADTQVGTRDPEHPAALNRYAYAANQPVTLTDPSGHVVDAGGAPGGEMPEPTPPNQGPGLEITITRVADQSGPQSTPGSQTTDLTLSSTEVINTDLGPEGIEQLPKALFLASLSSMYQATYEVGRVGSRSTGIHSDYFDSIPWDRRAVANQVIDTLMMGAPISTRMPGLSSGYLPRDHHGQGITLRDIGGVFTAVGIAEGIAGAMGMRLPGSAATTDDLESAVTLYRKSPGTSPKAWTDVKGLEGVQLSINDIPSEMVANWERHNTIPLRRWHELRPDLARQGFSADYIKTIEIENEFYQLKRFQDRLAATLKPSPRSSGMITMDNTVLSREEYERFIYLQQKFYGE